MIWTLTFCIMYFIARVHSTTFDSLCRPSDSSYNVATLSGPEYAPSSSRSLRRFIQLLPSLLGTLCNTLIHILDHDLHSVLSHRIAQQIMVCLLQTVHLAILLRGSRILF